MVKRSAAISIKTSVIHLMAQPCVFVSPLLNPSDIASNEIDPITVIFHHYIGLPLLFTSPTAHNLAFFKKISVVTEALEDADLKRGEKQIMCN